MLETAGRCGTLAAPPLPSQRPTSSSLTRGTARRVATGDTIVESTTKPETDGDSPQPTQPIDREPTSPPPSPDDQTRLYLALMMGALFIVLALAAVVQPAAEPVLNKVMPLLTMVLGYFFGRGVQRARS